MGELNRNQSLGSTESNGNRIHLLLHTTDGCVPYLNPNQLEQHFPPSKLWLGLAVRDCCVAPIFDPPSVSSEAQPEKRKRKSKKPNDTVTNRVRGYTFSKNNPDPWLLPYTRVTVPSFGEKHIAKGNFYGNSSKNTNNSVHVWTPHGRQKLTTDLYAAASLEGLKSQYTMSLFDDVDEEDFSARRKQKAVTRNQKWFQHLSSRRDQLLPKEFEGGNCSVSLWKPILLSHDGENVPRVSKEKNVSSAAPQETDTEKGKNTPCIPSGVAFVGRWRPGLELKKMISAEINVDASLDQIEWKAFLAASSLSEFLDIASTGIINVIGTNLPQKWAKEKLALGLDLFMEQSSSSPGESQDFKRQKIDYIEGRSSSKVNVATTDKKLLNEGCMDMSCTSYARDPSPLLPGCECFVCKENRFSKAYIHHLVVAKEMLAEILIFGHNLHCMLLLLSQFDCQESDRNKFKTFISSQLHN